MMTIDKFNFAGKKAIVRVDFNVPLDKLPMVPAVGATKEI
jgi:3-phosphoglycerate kinase